MRDPAGKGRSRVAPLRTCAARLLRARAQRLRRVGDRAEESRPRVAHLLRPHPSARYRKSSVPLDPAALPLRLHARLPGGNVYPHAPKPGYAGVTALEAPLRERIAREGPIPFREFMQTALYHPEYGYYRRPRD